MRFKVTGSEIAAWLIALIGICGIGYTRLDSYQEILTACAVMVFLLLLGRKNRSVYYTLKGNLFTALYLLFLGLVFASITYSLVPSTTIKYAIQYSLIGMFVLFQYSESFVEKVIGVFVKVCTFVAITTIFSVALPEVFKAVFGWYFTNKEAVYSMVDQGNATGIIGHNAYAAGISNICVGYFIAKYFTQRKVSNKDWIILAIGFLAVLVTGKRVLLLSMVASVGILLILRTGKEKKRKIFRFAGIAVIMFGLMYAFLPVSRRLVDRVVNGLGDTTFNNRQVFWTEAMYLFSQKKMFGWGFGIFPYYDKNYASGWGYSAHNQYFEVIAELGAVGIVCFVLLILIALIISIKLLTNKRVQQNKTYSFIAFFVFYYQVWYVIYGLTGTPLYNYSQQFLFVLFSMFAVCLNRRIKREQELLDSMQNIKQQESI